MRTLVALCLLLTACGHGHHMHGGHGMEMRPAEAVWPTLRFDEPAGARFVMAPGVFGDGLDVVAPFQGQFQPTGPRIDGGYPLVLTLDAATAKRFGAEGPITLSGDLRVSARGYRGVLRIAPSECALRALIAGDLESLDVTAEELPTADVVCAGGQTSGCGGGGHAACPYHGGGGMHEGSCCGMQAKCGGMHGKSCGMHDGAMGCGGSPKHHCGHGRGFSWAPALLTLRVKR